MTPPPLPVEPRGHTKLWVAFWLYGVLASHVFFGAIIYTYREASTAVVGLMLAGLLLYTAWIMHTIWINALNVRNEFWGYLARWLTVAWALNAAMVSLFLLMGHMGKVVLPISI